MEGAEAQEEREGKVIFYPELRGHYIFAVESKVKRRVEIVVP